MHNIDMTTNKDRKERESQEMTWHNITWLVINQIQEKKKLESQVRK